MSLGNPQSFNRYSYVENEPTNFVDPSGLQLRYYDVYRGLACVVDENGVNRCIQYIDRYWYDDGASPWDTPDPTGGWEGPGGGENGGQFDCPNPQSPEAGPSITAAGALQHYIGGTGKDLNMDIKELSAEVPNLFAFPAISARIARGTSKPFEQVSIVRATTGVIRTTGDQAAFLGRITFNVTGVLNLYMTGDFQFYGSIGVNQDLYDFDKDQATGNNRRTPAGQSSTRIGSYIPGKGFNININGRFSLHVSGNPTGITSYSCK